MESHTPRGSISPAPEPPVIIITPANVAAIDSHTGQEGTTFRKTIMIATIAGNRNTSVVARPEAMYL